MRDTVENALASASFSSSRVARSRVGSIFDSTSGSGAKADGPPAWAAAGMGGGTTGWRTGAGGGALNVVKVMFPPRGGGSVTPGRCCWAAGAGIGIGGGAAGAGGGVRGTIMDGAGGRGGALGVWMSAEGGGK